MNQDTPLDHDNHDDHEHDRGLSHDLPTLINRRRALGLFGGAGLVVLAACSSNDSTTTPSPRSTTGSTTSSTEEIPEETGGPFPADGSNGVNVLTESGIVRGDITTSFGSANATAEGVPLTIELTVLDVGNGKPFEGAAVYLWHCDRNGRYSLYDDSIRNENYLRGVQAADKDGKVRFTSIFPAAYAGRWPHIHFEVYPSLDKATTASDKLRTSQLALPEKANSAVYATSGYETSVQNMKQSSLDSDNVFRDGYSLQLATVTGTPADGMSAKLNVPV